MPDPPPDIVPTAAAFAALRDRLLAAMRGGVRAWSDERFSELALAVYGFQRSAVPAYGAWCDAVGASEPTDWRTIPALPIAAFKRLDVRVPELPAVRSWHSSSTTGRGVSTHSLPDTLLYDASLTAGARAALLPEAPPGERAPLRAIQLAAPGAQQPHSSLSHMLDVVRTELVTEDDGCFADAAAVHADAAWDALDAAARDGAPVLLLATSFALVQLFDAVPTRRVVLPPGSRAMDTGGYKGRTRELTRDALVSAIGARLSVPATMCENEYGMSELSSQAYLGSIAAAVGAPLPHTGDGTRWQVPWMRTRVVDPITLDDVADGETGLLVHHDLANLGSCATIRSEDIGARVGDGYRFVGRAPGAQLRGCSLPLEAVFA